MNIEANSKLFFSDLLTRLIVIVESSGVFLKNHINIVNKQNNNPSTNIDIEIDNFLYKELIKLFPAEYLSEESHISNDLNSGWCWIVDPIDGTINMIVGLKELTISVALKNPIGQIVIGVVYAPLYHEIYSAINNQGAFLNKKKIVKSLIQNQQKIIAITFPQRNTENALQIGARITKLMSQSWRIRCSGSASLDICRVANKNWTSFYEEKLYIWDLAAAVLIAREAGCYVSRNLDTISSQQLLVSKCLISHDLSTYNELYNLLEYTHDC
jgi:myo-inositol-1(or 4)-monophosphatase